MWQNIDKTRPDSAHYSIQTKCGADGMTALRGIFPDGKADTLNFVLFSTSGVHGTYNTIEDAEKHVNGELNEDGEDYFGEVTFLIVHPRLVCLRYGCCNPETADDISFLKALRESSKEAVSQIGWPE